MAYEKRWTATYTKHVRQKRKVYQDGVLELGGSGKKVKLYDDTGKVIDGRFLKKDEVIESGGTLAMDNHLVDVGCLEGEQKPPTDLNVGSRVVKGNETSGKHELKVNKKATSKTGTLLKHSDVVDKGNRGQSFCNMEAYDASWPLTNFFEANGKTDLASSGAMQSHPNAGHPSVKEWSALYTTQVSQKAKRYHDGILRVSVCGSHTNHVVLLHEDGTVLSSKYIKSVGWVKTGAKHEFPNYLVEICEAHSSQIGVLASEQVGSSNGSKDGKLTNSEKAVCKKPRPNDGSHKDLRKEVISSSSSKSGNFTSRNRLNSDEQFRTARQILSVLKKPLAQENHVPEKLPMEQNPSSHPAGVQLSDLQSGCQILELKVPEKSHSKKDSKENNTCDIGDNSQTGSGEILCIKSCPSGLVSNPGISAEMDTKLVVPDAAATKLDMGSIEEISGAKNLPQKKVLGAESSSLLKVSEAVASDKHFSGGGPSVKRMKPSTISSYGKQNLADASCNLRKITVSTNVSEVGSTDILSFDGAKTRNSQQMYQEKAAEEKHEKVLCLDASSASSVATDTKTEGSEINCGSKAGLNIDDYPTFELGF